MYVIDTDLSTNGFREFTLRHAIAIVSRQSVYSFQNILGSSQWSQLLVFLYRYISLVQIRKSSSASHGQTKHYTSSARCRQQSFKETTCYRRRQWYSQRCTVRTVFADNDDTNEVRKKANELKPVFKPSVKKSMSDGVWLPWSWEFYFCALWISASHSTYSDQSPTNGCHSLLLTILRSLPSHTTMMGSHL